jgi:hypothetical protein
MTMAAAKVAGVESSHRPRTRTPRGNMRAKLLDYIGQVFECKAEDPHYLRRVLENWRGRARQVRRAQLVGRVGSFFFASRACRARLACFADDSRARAMQAKPLHSLT